MNMLRLAPALAVFVALGSLLLLPACETEVSSCETIAEACHDKDTGSGKPHDCHEATEKAGVTDAECDALETDCLAACK
jgi:hypothetical protein